MTRFWLVAGMLMAVNLLLATAITVWLPSGVVRGPAPPPFLLAEFPPRATVPAVRVSRDRAQQLESRIRPIVAAEMQRLGVPVAADAGPRGQIGLERDAPQPRRGPDRDVNALLTPFGVYRSGPAGLLMVLVSLATFVTAGTVTLYLAPGRLSRVRESLAVSRGNTLRLGTIGLLGYVLAGALLFVLVALVTGILFAFVLAVFLATATFAGLVALALAVGRWLRTRVTPKASSPLADLLLGIMAVFPLGLIPWIGWIFVLVLCALGFGALVATKFGSEEGWSLEPLRASLRSNLT